MGQRRVGTAPAAMVIAALSSGPAATAIAQCGDPSAGDCFEVHPTPFCSNVDCCETVCAIVPYCCETMWDETCVDAAVTFCTCGSPISGDCFEPNGNPGCDDADCCKTVCNADPFCCDGEWDGLCVLQARFLCQGCGNNAAGDCFEANGTAGCSHFACCTEVCATDPLCCETWDESCAEQAMAVCCRGDIDGNGSVDVDDLVGVITAWGPCQPPPVPCAADVNASRTVDVDDLVTVILQWGPCDEPG